MRKRSLLFKALTIILLLFSFVFATEAKGATSTGLTFEVERVIEIGDYKSISITVNNDTNHEYGFGWVSSCDLVIRTDEGKFVKSITGGTIKTGNKTYNYTLKAPGKIVSAYYTDIIEMNGKLPLHNSNMEMSIEIGEYSVVNGINVIIIAAAVVAVIFALVIGVCILKKKSISRGLGIVIFTTSVVVLIYAGYSFVVKPVLGQADFVDVAKKYWVLWAVGLVLCAIGQMLMHKGKKINNRMKYKYDGHQDFMNRMQRQQHEEQTRLFNEQVQRDNQQFENQQNDNFNNHNNGMF